MDVHANLGVGRGLEPRSRCMCGFCALKGLVYCYVWFCCIRACLKVIIKACYCREQIYGRHRKR